MTKEEVYDEQISEMMTKIIQICHDNKIAMIADFALDEDLKCLTVLLSEATDPPDNMVEAAKILRQGIGPSASPLMITTKDADGKVVNITAVL